MELQLHDPAATNHIASAHNGPTAAEASLPAADAPVLHDTRVSMPLGQDAVTDLHQYGADLLHSVYVGGERNDNNILLSRASNAVERGYNPKAVALMYPTKFPFGRGHPGDHHIVPISLEVGLPYLVRQSRRDLLFAEFGLFGYLIVAKQAAYKKAFVQGVMHHGRDSSGNLVPQAENWAEVSPAAIQAIMCASCYVRQAWSTRSAAPGRCTSTL